MSTSSKKSRAELRSLRNAWKPHKYQKRGVKFLLDVPGAGLFLDPGLGKTSIVLCAFSLLLEARKAKRMLVIAPIRVCHLTWPDEIKKWTDFQHMRCEILHGPDKDKAIRRDAEIYLINPEGLPWLLENNAARLKALAPDTLVVDESSKFKNPSSKRFKLLRGELVRFARRWILTGTPTPNGMLDLWSQIFICDLGKRLGKFITHYRVKYFDAGGYQNREWFLRDGSFKQIQTTVKDITLRMEGQDFLDLPPVVTIPIQVQLPDKARRMYEEIEDELFTLIDESTAINLPSAASALMKCRQIACGSIFYDEIDEEKMEAKLRWTSVHDEKLAALSDLLEEIDRPALVMYQFRHERERIEEFLKKFFKLKEVAVLGAGVSATKAREYVERSNAGKLPVLLGHPTSMGHGLNLQGGGDVLIWMSQTWSQEEYDQTIKRLARQGSKFSRIYNYLIIARKTVDEAMQLQVAEKTKNQKNFLDALKRYRVKK